jgi:tetratricopeptide (TPR) repeat protein
VSPAARTRDRKRERAPGSRPLVGRERELAALRAALDDAARGHGRLVLVAGEPGIGKSRLADAAARIASDEGFAVLWGRCWEAGGAPAFWPWTQVLRAHARRAGLERLRREAGPGGAYVAQIVPELARDEPPPAAEGDHARFALFDAIASLLVAAARDAPTLIALDDLHAADPPSLRMLEFLAHELRGAPLLVLAAYRDVDARAAPGVEELLARLAREGETLPLRGLGRGDVERLVAAAGVDPAPALVAALHEATGGNPFFLDELVRLLAAEGRLGEHSLGSGVPLTAGVRHTVVRRLERLSDDCLVVLRTAAAVGREFAPAVVERAAARTPADVAAALEEAERARLLHAEAGRRSAFAHDLIRETLYDGLEAAHRRTLHERIGEALEERYAGSVEPHLAELAHHFLAADDARGVEYAARAARHAAAQFAFEEAAALYERALAASPEPRLDLLLALGEARTKGGQLDAAREALARAAELARAGGDVEGLAHAALALAAPYTEAGFGDPLRAELLEEALSALAPEETRLRARLLARLAPELYWLHEFERADAVSADALELALAGDDPALLFETLDARHYALMGPDGLDAREPLSRQLVELAGTVGDAAMELRARLWRVHDRLERNDVDGARADVAALVRLAEAVRQPGHRWVATYLLAVLAHVDGRVDETERLHEQAWALGRRAGIADAAAVYFASGRWTLLNVRPTEEDLETPLEAVCDLYRALIPGFRSLLAWMHAARGRLADARREYERYAAAAFELPRDHNWLAWQATLAEVCVMLGDVRRAPRLYELLLPYSDRGLVGGFANSFTGSIGVVLGRLATTIGRFDEAERHFERALAANERMGARLPAADARAEYAAMLLVRGRGDDRRRADALLADAAREAAETGYVRVAGRCAELGAASPPPATTGAPRRAILRREGDFWTVAYSGPPFRVRDVRGLQLLARLLAAPGAEVAALELGGAAGADRGDAGELLDAKAKAAYRARLVELEQEVDDAAAMVDPEREARARVELDALVGELAGAVGLGRRDRPAASAAERARVNVTRRIRDGIARLAREDPALGRYLEATIRTGRTCSYRPDPERPVAWDL